MTRSHSFLASFQVFAAFVVCVFISLSFTCLPQLKVHNVTETQKAVTGMILILAVTSQWLLTWIIINLVQLQPNTNDNCY